MTAITLPQACRKAADFFDAYPEKWIKGSAASTASGTETSPDNPWADCFCAVGRIAKELDRSLPSLEQDQLLCAASSAVSGTSLLYFNDCIAQNTAGIAHHLRAVADKLEQPA